MSIESPITDAGWSVNPSTRKALIDRGLRFGCGGLTPSGRIIRDELVRRALEK